MPYENGAFEIEFDFVDHRLLIRATDGELAALPLEPRSVAAFYTDLMATLHSLGIDVSIHARPDEVPDPIPFAEDEMHRFYDGEYANRFWRILLSTHRVLTEFRSRFIGKCSPVHFFWGSFDLAVTRFSGRRALERAGADLITREAYSHEESSVGFWSGSGHIAGAAFYSYFAPQPAGYDGEQVSPGEAFYDRGSRSFSSCTTMCAKPRCPSMR